jgi:hypothetical protein
VVTQQSFLGLKGLIVVAVAGFKRGFFFPVLWFARPHTNSLQHLIGCDHNYSSSYGSSGF